MGTAQLPASPARPGLAIAMNSSFFGFYAHAAFMAALHDEGIFPEQVAGSSAGALVSVLCGAGLRGSQLTDFVMQPDLRRSFLDGKALLRLPGVLSSTFGSGILSGSNAVAFLRSKLHGLRLEDCHPAVQLGLTNLTHRNSRLISSGDAASYAVASCAVPGLFRNQIVDGERWCDGGVALPLPFLQWLDDPNVAMIVLHRIEHVAEHRPEPGWTTLAGGIADCHQIISDALHRLRQTISHDKRIIEIVTTTPHPGLFPSGIRPALLEAGSHAGREASRRIRAESGI
ncbi:MAG: patatin-like phospholipase family protein [Verrucomicrobiales bacterium]|nr:patatin-like phospholipase family protein [Verrucomicrobiales bacterium]